MATMSKVNRRSDAMAARAAGEERDRAAARSRMYVRLETMVEETARELFSRLRVNPAGTYRLIYQPTANGDWGRINIDPNDGGDLYNGWYIAGPIVGACAMSLAQMVSKLRTMVDSLPIVGTL